MAKGFITDDYLKNQFVDAMPKNVNLVMLIDACHSGTMVDLKFNYMVNKFRSYMVHDKVKESKCNVMMISGCRDDQTSADAYLKDYREGNWEHQGAMTASFIANYTDGISYEQLIKKMRTWIKSKKFTQVPQLSTGKYVNIREPILLSSYD